MKAIVYNKKASPEKLILQDVEKPIPNENEVLIKIKAVSPNASDYRTMKLGMLPKHRIFGSGISGIVEGVGNKIEKFNLGDHILGDLSDFGFGGFAEYCVAPEKAIVHKSDKLDFNMAATLPAAAPTALTALKEKGEIKKNQKVIIVGSSGGVGTYAVQLAKYFGTEVTGVCSTRNMNQTLSLGADYVIDYKKEDFTKSKTRYDLIIAINGNYSLMACRRLLNEHGIYVMVGGSMGQIFRALVFGRILSMGSKKIRSLSYKMNPPSLNSIVNLADQGEIKPVIEKVYRLGETAKAMKYLSAGHVSGKIVIQLD